MIVEIGRTDERRPASSAKWWNIKTRRQRRKRPNLKSVRGNSRSDLSRIGTGLCSDDLEGSGPNSSCSPAGSRTRMRIFRRDVPIAVVEHDFECVSAAFAQMSDLRSVGICDRLPVLIDERIRADCRNRSDGCSAASRRDCCSKISCRSRPGSVIGIERGCPPHIRTGCDCRSHRRSPAGATHRHAVRCRDQRCATRLCHRRCW